MAARTLACIADVLGAMAGEGAGLRSGPARNESWMQAFELLDVCIPLCCLMFSTRILAEFTFIFLICIIMLSNVGARQFRNCLTYKRDFIVMQTS